MRYFSRYNQPKTILAETKTTWTDDKRIFDFHKIWFRNDNSLQESNLKTITLQDIYHHEKHIRILLNELRNALVERYIYRERNHD